MRTEKRVVVISGASSGIGLGLYNLYKEAGDIVLDISRHSNDYVCDVSDSEKLKKVVDEIYKEYGPIDILIANAGYSVSGAVELIDETEAKKMFDVNYFGTTNLCKYAIPKMNPNGKIVCIASAMALFPVPFQAYYSSSKAAVDNFSTCLRMELSKTKLQVTSICPSYVRTNFSKNRLKVYETNERYGDSIKKTIEPTQKSEAKRMPQEKAVKIIYKICDKNHLKPRYIIGTKYKIFNFFRKLLPKSWMTKIINSKIKK